MNPEDFLTKKELLNWEYSTDDFLAFEEAIGTFTLFWKPGHHSYEFIVGEWMCSDVDGSNVRYSRIARGWAAFDGVRHIWFEYCCYPDLESYEALFKRLPEINLKQLGVS